MPKYFKTVLPCMHNYLDINKQKFPYGMTHPTGDWKNFDGNPGLRHTWIPRIWPFIEQSSLYEIYDFKVGFWGNRIVNMAILPFKLLLILKSNIIFVPAIDLAQNGLAIPIMVLGEIMSLAWETTGAGILHMIQCLIKIRAGQTPPFILISALDLLNRPTEHPIES